MTRSDNMWSHLLQPTRALGIALAALGVVAGPGALAQASEADPTPGEPYREAVPGTELSLEMQPVPGGRFHPGGEGGPEVTVGDFWMSSHEISWDVYDAFRLSNDVNGPALAGGGAGAADAVTRPTPPYGDESFGFGKGERPAIAMTHHAAMEFTAWLSRETGRAYRLATEAEWEYACRGGAEGTAPAADVAALTEVAWFLENADFRTEPVGQLAPNELGLHDMLGNVAEWVLDRFEPDAWSQVPEGAERPVVLPGIERYPHVVKGGSWDDDVEDVSCTARRGSEFGWSRRDPQIPQSIWWHTDATFVGFRIVRAVEEDERLVGLRSEVTEDSP